MNGNLFQGILDIITPYLPNGFEKVVGYLEYGKASYSFAFYACRLCPDAESGRVSDRTTG